MVNLIFAISSLSFNANEKFQKMKNIIKTMVNEYGKERIHYSLIVFGNEPSVELPARKAKTVIKLSLNENRNFKEN